MNHPHTNPGGLLEIPPVSSIHSGNFWKPPKYHNEKASLGYVSILAHRTVSCWLLSRYVFRCGRFFTLQIGNRMPCDEGSDF